MLIVDDSEFSRKLIMASVAPLDIRVSCASTGQEALALCVEQAFDLILTDLNMPGMNGLELIRRIRSQPHLADCRAFLVTSSPTPALLEQGRQVGVTAWILKPINPENLRIAIRRVLDLEAGADSRQVEPPDRAAVGREEPLNPSRGAKPLATLPTRVTAVESGPMNAGVANVAVSRPTPSAPVLLPQNQRGKTLAELLEWERERLGTGLAVTVGNAWQEVALTQPGLRASVAAVALLEPLAKGPGAALSGALGEDVRQPVLLVELVSRLCQQLGRLGLVESQALRLERPDGELAVAVPAWVAGHVCKQLLSNAALALDNALRPALLEVSIAIPQEAGRVELSVRDNGGGVAPELAERMFEPYCTSRDGALGLGLTAARMLARRWQGDVRYAAHTDVGSCFRAIFPKWTREHHNELAGAADKEQ